MSSSFYAKNHMDQIRRLDPNLFERYQYLLHDAEERLEGQAPKIDRDTGKPYYHHVKDSMLSRSVATLLGVKQAHEAINLYMFINYLAMQEQVVLLGPKLQNILSLTNVDIPCSEISFPYPSFFVSMDTGNWSCWGSKRPYGAYVFSDISDPYNGLFEDGDVELGIREYKNLSWDVRIMIAVDTPGDEANQGLISFDLRGFKGEKKTVEEKFDQMLLSGYTKATGVSEAIACGEFHKFLRIIFNAIAYMGCKYPKMETHITNERKEKKLKKKIDCSHGEKKERLKRELRSLSKRHITRILPEVERERRADVCESTGRKNRGHWRRGHWRNQPFGPRNDPMYYRKLIFPQFVGDESNPVDRDHYQVPLK